MNKNLFFFILASALFILSVFTSCLAPIINASGIIYTGNSCNLLNVFDNWRNGNCQLLDDIYKHNKDTDYYSLNSNKAQEPVDKRKIDECKNHKAMFGLEYAASISNIVLGFICTLLGLINYLDQGKPFEKTSGLIGIVAGGISTVLTIIYVVYSGKIFNNEIAIRGHLEFLILYDNKAFLHWDGSKYVANFDDQDYQKDSDIRYVKIKDLGKKQYNYDSELTRMLSDTESEYYNCQKDKGDLVSNFYLRTTQEHYTSVPTKNCDYLWTTNIHKPDYRNKYLYDRWLTTIIFSILICVCGIGLAIFGFLLFKGNKASLIEEDK